MIKQQIKVKRISWIVYVYYSVTKDNIEEILFRINKLHLPISYSKSAYSILSRNKFNSGFTYSNTKLKQSIVVITKTTSASEFVNSFIHEIGHLANHIALTYHLDRNGEEIQYIAGDIGQEMFKRCHTLMCDCCRNEH